MWSVETAARLLEAQPMPATCLSARSRLFGWRMALVPFAYVSASFVVVEFIAPVSKTWRALGRERGRTWAVRHRCLPDQL